MPFKNVGITTLNTVATGAVRQCAMDEAGIASGQAFLTSELEKRDTLVRTPLSSFTYGRDITVRVGGGWVDFVSAMQVGYGITGGSGDSLVAAGGANGLPIVQADFSKGLYKAHAVAAALRVMWIDMQKNSLTGRNYDALLRDGLRMAYDKHLDENTYVGFKAYDTTGILNNPDVVVTDAAATGTASSTKWKDKTPDQILADFNGAILAAWENAGYDLDAVPNHAVLPYEQYNYIATTRVSELAEKTILTFLMENNVATQNGSDLFIGASNWCKGAAADGSSDRMVVYCNKERFIAEDELVPLTRAMTSAVTTNFCYDTAYAANVSEVQVFYANTMIYVDKI